MAENLEYYGVGLEDCNGRAGKLADVDDCLESNGALSLENCQSEVAIVVGVTSLENADTADVDLDRSESLDLNDSDNSVEESDDLPFVADDNMDDSEGTGYKFAGSYRFLPKSLHELFERNGTPVRPAEWDSIADLGAFGRAGNLNYATLALSHAVVAQTCMSGAPAPSGLADIGDGASDLSSLPGCVAKQIEEGRHNHDVSMYGGTTSVYFHDYDVDSPNAVFGNDVVNIEKIKASDAPPDNCESAIVLEGDDHSDGVKVNSLLFLLRRIGVALRDSIKSTLPSDSDIGDLSAPVGKDGLRSLYQEAGYRVLSGFGIGTGVLVITPTYDSDIAVPLASVVRVENFPDDERSISTVWQNGGFTWEGKPRAKSPESQK
ncbi:MAG: hypothetical protein WC897_03500 [Candidatus Gracilibacteria bacterium]